MNSEKLEQESKGKTRGADLKPDSKGGQAQPGEPEPRVPDTSRVGDPSFVTSGVSDGGRGGRYGTDEYEDRRNEDDDNPGGG